MSESERGQFHQFGIIGTSRDALSWLGAVRRTDGAMDEREDRPKAVNGKETNRPIAPPSPLSFPPAHS